MTVSTRPDGTNSHIYKTGFALISELNNMGKHIGQIHPWLSWHRK
jgi:hypothetical protein